MATTKSQVATIEDSVWVFRWLLAAAWSDLEIIWTTAGRNPAGRVFYAWQTYGMPGRRHFQEVEWYNIRQFADSIMGRRVPGVPNEGREGFWVKAFIDETPIRVAPWPPGYVEGQFGNVALSQGKGRKWVTAVGSDFRDRRLIRV